MPQNMPPWLPSVLFLAVFVTGGVLISLRPLAEQLERGRDLGVFTDIDPDNEAFSLHGVVWANVERHWASGRSEPSNIRERVQRFCLRGLGVDSQTIVAVLAERSAAPHLAEST